jgi:hypothetical protein
MQLNFCQFGPLRAFILWLLLLSLFLAGPAAAGRAAVKEDIPDGLVLLPRVGLSVEYGGFIVHQDHYASLLRRRLEADVLQYGRHIFYLEFDENTFFGTPFDKWDFNLLKYRVVLAGYRYDFGAWYLGIMFNHECNNPFLLRNYRTKIDRERANLYSIGLEALTKTMRLGMKNRGIDFDSPHDFAFLGRWHGSASVNKVLSKENADLDWFITAKVRYDILRYRRLVPYVEVGGEVLTGQALRLIPSVEVGARCHLARVDITPFFKWARTQEFLTANPATEEATLAAKNYLIGGARIEALVDGDFFSPDTSGTGLQLFPEVHGNAGYAFHSSNPFFKAFGNLALDFEVLRWQPWTMFFYTDMRFNTRKEDFKPDKVTYAMQYGLTYAWQRYFAEGFLQHGKRVDANIFRGTQERFNLGGLRAGTRGMKPGHVNDGISFTGPASFQWLNKWNAQASLGHFFNNRDWQYLWEVTAQARWDPVRWRFVIPYVQGELTYLSGGGTTGDVLEYAVESGLRLHGVLDFVIYYRFQHRDNVLLFGGSSQDQNLVGLRMMF